MPGKMVKEFLDKHRVTYESIPHSTAYTAQRTAASAHVTGKDLAKTVMVKIDERMAMAVLPAARSVDFDLLREATGEPRVTLATEEEFAGMFPECELGAMPPFGNLYGMDVYVAPELADRERIVFNAGTHSELIRLAYEDFERLVKPKVVAISFRA